MSDDICDDCNGTGQEILKVPLHDGGHMIYELEDPAPCETCAGDGCGDIPYIPSTDGVRSAACDADNWLTGGAQAFDRWLYEVRAEAAELAVDEIHPGLIVALWNAATTEGDAYQETEAVVKDYLHGWAAKFRDGAE